MGNDSTEPPAPAAPTPGLSPATGCALLVLVALLGGAFCFGLGALLFRGEIRLPGAGPAQARVWLVRERENQGLGISTSRLIGGSLEGVQACFETRVAFLLWKRDGTSQASQFCQCYERQGEAWLLAGDCPP